MEFLAEFSYPGLFLSAFLAATILPLSSEVVLALLLANGFSPVSLVGAATAGNVLGSVVNYWLGMLGSDLVFKRVLSLSDVQLEKAENRFRRYGVFSLLFAWLPVVGDPLTVAAGVFKVRFDLFVLLVGIGKCGRYIFLAAAVLAAAG